MNLPVVLLACAANYAAYGMGIALFDALLAGRQHYPAKSFLNDPLGDRTRIRVAISIEDDKYERNFSEVSSEN